MGQRQRVALARALYGAPRLVVLDEPTAWLDAEGEAAVERMLRRLRDAGVSVVLSSHRTGVIGAADRVLVMGTGGTLRPAPLAGSGKVITFDARPAA
jgi:ABC-type protease/lipase transport system fused ATPase/permease subunit